MKNIMVGLMSLAVVLSISTAARAQSACGGTIMHNPDCDSSDRSWSISCCPDGYRVQGVAYNDIRKQDHVDAVSAICRSVSRGNDMMPNDFSHRAPTQYVCDKQEVLSGVFFKDVRVQGGDDRDTLDGVTAVCENPKNHAKRQLYNADISGGRTGVELSVSLPRRVVGIAYKELDKGTSDRADCVTIITR